MTIQTPLKFAVGVIGLSLLIAAAAPGAPALACAPQIKFDPVTGLALPDPDLKMALEKINAGLHVADAR